MRFLQYLQEDYVTSCPAFSSRDPDIEVFVNPTKKEIREAAAGNYEIRYLIDLDNKNLYIWNAIGQIHYRIAEKLNFGRRIYREDCFIFGNIKLGERGWNEKFKNSYNTFNSNIVKDRYDYKWLEAFFDKAVIKDITTRELFR